MRRMRWLSRCGRARRLTDQEGQRPQIVRRGKHGSIRVRRALIIMASASGTPVSAIAGLVAADEDTVRDVIHLFNQKGLAALDPNWAGGRPRRISDGDIEVIVTATTSRPEKLGLPFTCSSLRKLAAYLAARPDPVTVGRERLRQNLHARGVTFQRTRTWKESADPERDAKLDRIEEVTSRFPHRCYAFDQFGPVRTFVTGGSDHLNHTVLARRLQDCLRWRNTNARPPDVLAAQRRERARIRSERQQRWGRPRPKAA
jgi:transposase